MFNITKILIHVVCYTLPSTRKLRHLQFAILLTDSVRRVARALRKYLSLSKVLEAQWSPLNRGHTSSLVRPIAVLLSVSLLPISTICPLLSFKCSTSPSPQAQLKCSHLGETIKIRDIVGHLICSLFMMHLPSTFVYSFCPFIVFLQHRIGNWISSVNLHSCL